MAKKYVRIAIWKETHETFMKRCNNFNRDLRDMGVNKRIPLIRFLNGVAKGRTKLDNIDEM